MRNDHLPETMNIEVKGLTLKFDIDYPIQFLMLIIGSQSRRGNQNVTERSPLLNSSGQRNDEGSGFNCCTVL